MNHFLIRHNRVRNTMESNGYVPPTEGDLVAGRTFVQVVIDETPMAYSSQIKKELGDEPGTTVIVLTDEPVSTPSGSKKPMVHFRCVNPPFSRICSVPVSDFTLAGYVHKRQNNDPNIVRFFVRR